MEKLRKVLIIYTNSGAGHRRAAEALFQLSQAYFPAATIRLIDTLDYATPLFKNTYPQTYLFLVKHLPWLWGLAYYLLDIPFIDKISRVFRRITNAGHCRKFEQFILDEQPDLVITTHFLPNEIITHLKKAQKIRTFLATCLTDYYPHAIWRDQGVDLYITPNAALNHRLEKLGVAREKIRALGIPIDPVFSVGSAQPEIRRQLEISPEKFTVLIAGGGFGVGPIAKLVAEVAKIAVPLNFMVVCGNNPKLREELLKKFQKSIHEFKIFGFVQNMHELMDAGDLLITKSGGLTVTEALAKHLPLLILYPIPGQESGNCNFVVANGAGVKVKNPKEARIFIEKLLDQPRLLKEFKVKMNKLGRPEAAGEILSCLRKVIGGDG